MSLRRDVAKRSGGFGLTEAMMAIGIVAAALLVLVQQLSIGFRESSSNEDRSFAYQKAAAILGEIQNSISLGVITTGDELLALADTKPQLVLTTRRDAEGLVFAPEHPMSGNVKSVGEWRWSRRVEVEPHETTGQYWCRVHIDLRDGAIWRGAASHAMLFSLLPPADAPEQVHDVYVLACAEAPGLWTDIAELRDHVESVCNEIAAQSQARFQLHWITRLGYGRDACYVPFVNTTIPATQSSPAAYWMPGRLGGSGPIKTLFQSELIVGTHRTEAGLVHGVSGAEAIPSAIADRFNHCMRSPAAWRTFAQRVTSGAEFADEPPLQLLLDDLQQRPERYRNAIFLNLHGRGLPMPPLRNYSDAAKDPLARPGVRVVTHPARLWTPRDPDGNGSPTDADPVELRVYAYRTANTDDILVEPILVQIYGGDFTGSINGSAGSAATLEIRRMVGGIDLNKSVAGAGAASYATFDSATGIAPTSATEKFDMYFQAGYVGGADPYTWIRLYNTPLCAPVHGLGGLDPSAQLYGLDYNPSPVSGNFARDLATKGVGRINRNTARWRIRIPNQVFSSGLLPDQDHVLRVVTRIGSSTNTGVRWPTPIEPMNLSETFAWWSDSATAVPPTERAQFLGDPRLCPYSDLAVGGATTPDGYNANFDDLVNGLEDARLEWPCFGSTLLRDGLGDGVRADSPRLLQLLRDGLQHSGAVYVAAAPELASVLLLGGEIALPSAAGTAAVAMHSDFGGGTLPQVDTVAPSSTTACGELVLTRGGSDPWYHKPWLGELFPDDAVVDWLSRGNLTPTSSPPLHWVRMQSAPLANLPYGASVAGTFSARLGILGAPALVATNQLTSMLSYGNSTPAPLTPAPPTSAINDAVNLAPPRTLTSSTTIQWPSSSGLLGSSIGALSGYQASTLTLLESMWQAAGSPCGASYVWQSSLHGAAALALWTAPNATDSARSVAQQAVLLGLRTLHAFGAPKVRPSIAAVPRVLIFDPAPGALRTDPSEITLRWNAEWLRFDGQAYTANYPTGFAGDESDLVYRVLWSRDRGATWLSALTGDVAEFGVYPTAIDDRLADTGQGSESFTFAMPDDLPTGEVRFAIEAWRTSTQSHHATHRAMVFVRRSNG